MHKPINLKTTLVQMHSSTTPSLDENADTSLAHIYFTYSLTRWRYGYYSLSQTRDTESQISFNWWRYRYISSSRCKYDDTNTYHLHKLEMKIRIHIICTSQRWRYGYISSSQAQDALLAGGLAMCHWTAALLLRVINATLKYLYLLH